MLILKKISYVFERLDRHRFYSLIHSLGYNSLREVCSDLGVSVQYLSLVLNGRKKVSKNFFTKLRSKGIYFTILEE